MLFSHLPIRLAALLYLLLPVSLWAAEPGAMKEDKGQVSSWNRFADDLYALHQRQIAGRAVRQEEKLGGYANLPDFYRQVKYFDADSGVLLSEIQWESEHPERIHSIAVFRHDEQGRVLRDYSATFLPEYRNAPVQTLVFLHQYPQGVHAFRSFDASNELLYERCEGSFEAKPVSISLDIDELEAAQGERYRDQRGILTEPAYRHCFGGLPDTAAAALPPR